jgi:hypothetical protein
MKPLSYGGGMLLFAAFVGLLTGVAIIKPTMVTGKPAQVILIRHAEKPPEGQELSERGKERAAALAPFFRGRKEVLTFGAPVAIYGERPHKVTSSIRPVETVSPLAHALNQEVIEKFTRKEIDPLAQEILSKPEYAGKMVLVCWEHSMIPPLAKALGCTTAPDKWHGDDFDQLWIITYQIDGTASFRKEPQKLLFGDSAK